MFCDARADNRPAWKRLSLPSGRLAICLFAACAAPAAAQSAGRNADTVYEANLGPSPLDEASKPNIDGRGAATATLAGDRLTIQGQFGGLPSPASDAHLQAGIGIGVPGNPIFDLTVTPGTSGTVSGGFSLTSKQVSQFKAGNFYVQINTKKAGPPFGTLWGWLLPRQDRVDADAPQQGSWYLPPHGPGLHE
jgi:hypothetical protein